jgi:hypothetical protein
MITCSICKKFAKPHSLKFNRFLDCVIDFKVECKKHGIVMGLYDDFDELEANFDIYRKDGKDE